MLGPDLWLLSCLLLLLQTQLSPSLAVVTCGSLTEEIRLRSQKEVEVFSRWGSGWGRHLRATGASSACEEVLGKLVISGSSITSLSALSSLRTVGDGMTVSSTSIRSFAGLRLTSVTGMLDIFNNSALVSLDGLGALQRVGKLVVQANPALESLSGLEGLSQVQGNLEVVANPKLHSLFGLGSIQTIWGCLQVQETPLRVIGSFAGSPRIRCIQMDSRSWPSCITASERFALSAMTDTSAENQFGPATTMRWQQNECGPQPVSCVWGGFCEVQLLASNRSNVSAPELLGSVVAVSRHGAVCGSCVGLKNATVNASGVVSFGWRLATEEPGVYTLCRCSHDPSKIGPLAEFSIVGPHGGEEIECALGESCDFSLARGGVGLHVGDEISAMRNCYQGEPLPGGQAILENSSGHLRFHFEDQAKLSEQMPSLYELCWKVPCLSPQACTASSKHARYLKMGHLSLLGPFKYNQETVLGYNFSASNQGFHTSAEDKMMLLRHCGQPNNHTTRFARANCSSSYTFDFGRLLSGEIRALVYEKCWCQPRPGLRHQCTLPEHFSTSAGLLRILCPAGTEDVLGNGLCEACPPGSYKPAPGNHSCVPCPAGMYAASGATKCMRCPLGQAVAPGSGRCVHCEAGEYPSSMQLQCLPCQAGRFSEPGSVNCTACPDGHVAPRGSGRCNACQAGKHSSQKKHLCLQCGAGNFSITGSATCQHCPHDRVAPPGSGQCSACGTGKYPSSTKSECLHCPSGYFALPGSAVCSACPVGRVAASGSGNCTACGAGKYASDLRGECLKCLPGYFSEEGSSACTECPHGRVANGAGNAQCVDCGAGMAPSGTRAECLMCPVGKASRAEDDSCKPCSFHHVAKPGSEHCHECSVWEISSSDHGNCVPGSAFLFQFIAYLVLLEAAFLLTILTFKTGTRISDVWYDDGRTWVCTAGGHRLRSRIWKKTFPIKFAGTEHPRLDDHASQFYARVELPTSLELLGQDGQVTNQRLDTSTGRFFVPFPHQYLHTGVLLPMALWIPLIFIAATVLAILTLSPKAALIGAVVCGTSSLALALGLCQIRWTTPLERRLEEYRLKLQRDGCKPTPCPKGPHRAISVGKLVEVHDFFRGFIKDRNAYYMDGNIFRPLTKTTKLSFAEFVGSSTVQFFVSHYWGTSFGHFCDSLRAHAEAKVCGSGDWATTAYWVCFCSINQYCIKEELGESWQESSFFITLQSGLCKGTCMVVDSAAMPLTRSWCIFELLQTLKLERQGNFQGLELSTATGLLNEGNGSLEVALNLVKRVAVLDLESAEASCQKDKEMINSLVVAEMGSFDLMNAFMRREIRRVLERAQSRFSSQFTSLFALLELVGSSSEGSEVHRRALLRSAFVEWKRSGLVTRQRGTVSRDLEMGTSIAL